MPSFRHLDCLTTLTVLYCHGGRRSHPNDVALPDDFVSTRRGLADEARRSALVVPWPDAPWIDLGAPLAGTSPRTLPLSLADTPADSAPTTSAAVSPLAPAPPNGATLNDGISGHPTTITAADGNASVALGATGTAIHDGSTNAYPRRLVLGTDAAPLGPSDAVAYAAGPASSFQ